MAVLFYLVFFSLFILFYFISLPSLSLCVFYFSTHSFVCLSVSLCVCVQECWRREVCTSTTSPLSLTSTASSLSAPSLSLSLPLPLSLSSSPIVSILSIQRDWRHRIVCFRSRDRERRDCGAISSRDWCYWDRRPRRNRSSMS